MITDVRGFDISDVKLDVQAYYFQEGDHDSPSKRRTAGIDADEDDMPQLRVTMLPSRSLNGAWDSLVFDDPIPSRLLKFMTRMMTLFRNPAINSSVINWNRLMLLHGPPGTGKSTLAKALAQKLTIRLGKHFTQGKLVEINAQAVLSKWFGESSKLVGRMFDAVLALAEEETTLVCLVIDEVETLTSSREKASNSNECGDAVRATNQVLTALDQLRHRQNVIVICTSNLIETIDVAFLDRVDIKQFVPCPRAEAIFDIFRSSINELIRCELLVPSPDPKDVVVWHPRVPMKVHYEHAWETDACWRKEFAEAKFIFPLHVTITNLNHRPNSPSRRVLRAAKRCVGLSGRTLRRLPFLALAMYTDREPCKVYEGLAALSRAIDVELKKNEPMQERIKDSYVDEKDMEEEELEEDGERPYTPTVQHPYYDMTNS
ncbi:AAA-domain-containing protein [Mytilinidion resinicola]|uniref:AAA-domain-containing protein n=1 Tax=Mytilinidion resinicola TaxID=574789 RepID=A0A6A6YN26_9PEZI|nr:AAA-domain-containing protein [Mytilinidion resinicola]KAF2809959.1 AAA-domain-containing protein [Mytilinidion resinicola]